MIDFIKIKILNPDIQRIRNNPRLEWFEKASTRTGEIKEQTATFHGITFEIKNNQYLNISGSLHKFWNATNGQGEQNFNDFRFSDLAGVIIDLIEWFELVKGSCKIENIEFGVNISPTIPVNEILRSVINHKGKPFSQEYSENKRFRECERQRYIIKVYNKGLQYNQPGNILRFENKIIKMEHLKEIGIYFLTDLLNTAKIDKLGAILQANFNELLFYDYTIKANELPPAKRLILSQGQNPGYWCDLLEKKPDGYYSKRKRFVELVKRYGTQNLQEIISPLISGKWDELKTHDPKIVRKLTDPAKTGITEINHSDKGLKPVNFPHDEQPDQRAEVVALNTTPEPGEPDHGHGHPPDGEQSTETGRYCLSCGRDISHQKPGSKFCSERFVGYESAHRCRNIDSNPRNRIKNKIERENERGILFLFDPVSLSTMNLHNSEHKKNSLSRTFFGHL